MLNYKVLFGGLIIGTMSSLPSAAASLDASCSGAPSGFSVALVADAGIYAEKKAKLTCKSFCEQVTAERVKAKKPLQANQLISFEYSDLLGFGARGSVVTELCKDGALYKGSAPVEVTYVVNGVSNTATVRYPIAMPNLQFVNKDKNKSVWQFKVESIKSK